MFHTHLTKPWQITRKNTGFKSVRKIRWLILIPMKKQLTGVKIIPRNYNFKLVPQCKVTCVKYN